MNTKISQVQIRLTPDLKTHLLLSASRQDISLSEYLRNLISQDQKNKGDANGNNRAE